LENREEDRCKVGEWESGRVYKEGGFWGFAKWEFVGGFAFANVALRKRIFQATFFLTRTRSGRNDFEELDKFI